MKHVSIITYHRHDNYGAVLQCYALQEAIVKIGGDVSILDYICQPDIHPYSFEAVRARGLFPCLKSCVGMIMRIPRRRSFQKFRTRLKLSQAYTKENIDSVESQYDCFLVGSDNVWNPGITGFDTTYFLDFVKDKKKCYSYASSMGFTAVPDRFKPVYKELLSNYQIISVREKKAAENLSNLLGRQVLSVLDPTLLLLPNDWDKIAINSDMEKPYILAYQMLPDREFIKFANKQAKKYGCRLVFIPFPQGGISMWAQSKIRIGPEEWLGLVKGATYVITDSFHGCAFSILFHKKFAIKITQLGERIFNLINSLDLASRIVSDEDFDLDAEISYKQVDDMLLKLRLNSFSVLEQILLD